MANGSVNYIDSGCVLLDDHYVQKHYDDGIRRRAVSHQGIHHMSGLLGACQLIQRDYGSLRPQ